MAVSNGFRGLVFIFDEFGKVFEEAYLNKKNSDLFVLQELAEAACRSGDTPILFIGLLHQGFGNYVEDVQDANTKNEFNKIQGRFQDISFVETPAAQMRMLANALRRTRELPIADDRNFDALIASAHKKEIALHSIAGLSADDFSNFCKKVWPLHPLSFVALPYLFKRFAQNERSVFSYLMSNEPQGFNEFLRNAETDSVLRLPDIFDYFMANYEIQLSRHPQGKIFLEALDTINSKSSLGQAEQDIIKSVAVLSALGTQSHIKATAPMIKFAVAEIPDGEVLHGLIKNSLLVYRNFNSTYALWEGSDIDLLDCSEKADRELGRRAVSIAEPLKKYLPPKPIVAKRHSFETGALRYFDVDYIDSPDMLAASLDVDQTSNAAGKIIVCLSGSDAVIDTFSSEAMQISTQQLNLIFAIPHGIEELRSALFEVMRLRWISENIKELRDDRIARREVAMRLADAEQKVMQQQYSLLDPREAPTGSSCCWVWSGEKQNTLHPREVSQLLSTVCDKLFPLGPEIRNEMICKREPSGQAAAARNTLITKMINPENEHSEFFNIEGFPPERSIYECLFFTSGIHREISGEWRIAAPVAKHDQVKISPCWQHLENRIFEGNNIQPIPLKELYAELSAPPYGLLDGVHPLLLTAFYVANRDEVTLYQEGSFLNDPQAAQFEIMVRRPDLFAIAGARISGTRELILRRFAKGFSVAPKVVPIVRYFYKMINALSKYASNTERVSEKTARFRLAFKEAKSPEMLLFDMLPEAIGVKAVKGGDTDEALFKRYFDGINQCLQELNLLLPNLKAEQRKILLDACDLPNSTDGWRTLYDRACYLAPRIVNAELTPLLQNIVNTAGDIDKADAVLGYMVSVPLSNWGPLELNKFPALANGKAELFLNMWKPYSRTSTDLLDRNEKHMAQALTKKLRKVPDLTTCDPKIARAALLAYLEELERTEGNN